MESHFGRSRLLFLLLGLSWSAQAVAQDVAPPVPDEAEVAAFKETMARYQDRMNQFDQDARAYLQAVETEQRQQLAAQFTARMNELDDAQIELTSVAIARFERFLAKYPNSENTAHAMFRLGELHYDKTELDFALAEEEYERRMDGFDYETALSIPEAPQKDYSRSIALYRRIIDEHPQYAFVDGAYYMLGFCLARDGSLQYDEIASRDVFQALVDAHPDSRFAIAAHLRLGDYYFDYNQVDQAIPHYERVIALSGSEGDLYDDGLYKLAWAFYKKDEFTRSLTLFTELLDWSKQNFARTGFQAATAPEAIEYSAITFSDLGDRNGVSPLEEAKAFYRTTGERDFEKDVYVRLAGVLTDQARFEESIQVYRYLQKRWPEDPENPTHQWRVAQISYTLDDPEGAQEAIAELTEVYNDDSPWWTANRKNPEAQAVARGYIEKSLAAVATGYHNEGITTEDEASLARAADLYGQYLRKFPFAEDYYEIQWYRADTLMRTGQFDEAEVEFLQLLKSNDHAYRDGALWSLMQVRKGRLEQRYANLDERPADAVEEKRVTLQSGEERVVWKLTDEHTGFIEVAQTLLTTDLKDPDFREALDKNRVPLKYLIAQIYYHHGHYDLARPRLEDLIDRHPEWDEAAYAAAMMINSYQEEGDLTKVKMLAVNYAGRPLGGGVKKRDEFGNLAEQASFKLAEQLIEIDRVEAAKAFETFMVEYPKSKYVTDAHYNAANSYEIAGRIDQANALFKQYIDNIRSGTYKQDDRSRALFFRIANNYSEVLDLDNAIKYYEELYKRFPDYQDSSAAVYNAAFLRIGLGDHRGAAENFEKYVRLNPTPSDAELVMFAAGEQWERVGKTEAIEFYRRYLARYPDASPDRAIEARYRIAKLTEETGASPAAIDKAYEELGNTFARLAPGGGVGARGRQMAGFADVRRLEAMYARFEVVSFKKSEEQNVKVLLDTKPAEIKEIEDLAMSIVSTYADFDSSAAAIYYLGRAYLRYSDMLFEAPPPKGLDEESKSIYYEEIDKLRIPIEDKGRARLQVNLDKAAEAKRWNEWVSRTLTFLADRFPGDFAMDKAEIRGQSASTFVPRAAAMPLRPKPEEPATETQPAAPEGGAQ